MKDQKIELPDVPFIFQYGQYNEDDLRQPGYRLIPYGDFQEIMQAYARSAIEPYVKRIAELEADNSELERLCDETYVAKGADAYNHACEVMEDWQEKRAKAGKEVGMTGSLCGGLAWLYAYIDKLEADRKKFGRNDNDRGNDNDNRKCRGSIVNNASANSEPVAWIRKNGFRFISEIEPQDDSEVPLYVTPRPLSESDIPAEPVSRDVEALVRLLEDGEWAEHVARTPLGQRLELAITTLVGEVSKLHNEPVNTLSDAEIREVFLANGFTIKPGHDDLKPYVYDAARALLARYKYHI